jgi:hypothetical protein
MGMVGGGKNAFIGPFTVPANIDGLMNCTVVLWLNAEISKESGKTYFFLKRKCYSTYQEMFLTESLCQKRTYGFCYYRHS